MRVGHAEMRCVETLEWQLQLGCIQHHFHFPNTPIHRYLLPTTVLPLSSCTASLGCSENNKKQIKSCRETPERSVTLITEKKKKIMWCLLWRRSKEGIKYGKGCWKRKGNYFYVQGAQDMKQWTWIATKKHQEKSLQVRTVACWNCLARDLPFFSILSTGTHPSGTA